MAKKVRAPTADDPLARAHLLKLILIDSVHLEWAKPRRNPSSKTAFLTAIHLGAGQMKFK